MLGDDIRICTLYMSSILVCMRVLNKSRLTINGW